MTSQAQPPVEKTYRLGLLIGTAAGIWAIAAGRVALAAPLVLIPLVWWMLGKAHRWVTLFLIAALCLPPLPIPLGDTGLHPALGIVAVGLLAGVLRWSEWRRPAPAASLWLVVYLLALLASVSFAAIYSGPAVAAASLARVGLFGISIYLFFYTVCGTEEAGPEAAVRRLYWAGVFSASFACIDFYWQLPAPAGFAPQFVWLQSGVYRRAQGFFYEASTLGNVCAFFLVMVAVCLARPRRETLVRRPLLAAGAGVLLAALMLSFSRASVVNLCVAGGVLLFLNRRRLRWGRLAAILTLAIAAGVAATYALIPAVVEFYWLRLRISAGLLASGDETVLSGRLDTWRRLAGFLLDHPEHAIFGVGYKTLPYSDFIGQAAVADNGYLSSLLETGLVGLAALLLLHWAILSMAWRAAHHANRQAAFFGTWALCFWAGEMVQMLSGDLLTYWRVLPVYLWVLAMAVRHSRQPEPE